MAVPMSPTSRFLIPFSTRPVDHALVVGDRRTGKIVLLSRWESVAAAEAAEAVYQDAMRELGRFLAEPPTREPYEVLLEA